MGYSSIKVERAKRLCQDLKASPGVEPRAFNDISQPPNFLINRLILGDEKRQYLLLATYSTINSCQKKPIISLGCRYYTIRSKHMSYLPLVIGPPVQAWGSFWNPSLYNNKHHHHHLSGNLATLLSCNAEAVKACKFSLWLTSSWRSKLRSTTSSTVRD